MSPVGGGGGGEGGGRGGGGFDQITNLMPNPGGHILRSNLPSGPTIDTIAPDYHVIKCPTVTIGSVQLNWLLHRLCTFMCTRISEGQKW